VDDDNSERKQTEDAQVSRPKKLSASKMRFKLSLGLFGLGALLILVTSAVNDSAVQTSLFVLSLLLIACGAALGVYVRARANWDWMPIDDPEQRKREKEQRGNA
jgi:hypothetical protein